LNLYIDRTKPWAVAKQKTPEAEAELAEIMFTLLEGIRWVATALLPVLPFGMPEVFRQLEQPVPPEKGGLAALQWGEVAFKPGEPKPIYPRL
jgi:methionyl-tRNA synthetase